MLRPERFTPYEAYTAIIDELVNETSRGVCERAVRESSDYRSNDKMNEFG